MKTELIETFITIVQCGTLSKAADALFISQPTISHRIVELENELGVILFERKKGNRNIVLTEHGLHFLNLAEEWRNLLVATRRLKETTPRESLRISVAHTLANSIFSDVAKQFLQRNLPVNLHIMTSSSFDALYKVKNNELDFALVGNTRVFSHAVSKTLAREKIVMVSHNESIYGEHVRVKDLKASDELYINWGNEQLLWHQRWFGIDFVPSTRVENTSIAEAFFSTYPQNLWMPVAFSAAEIMLKTQNLKVSYLDDPIPSREIQLISNIPVKQKLYDCLYEDILAVLSTRDGFTLI